MRRRFAGVDPTLDVVTDILRVPEIAQLDFDDMMVPKAASVDFLYSVVEDMGIDQAVLDAARTEQSPLGYMFESINQAGHRETLHERYTVGDPGLMEQDVLPFLGRLADGGVSGSVMTFGEDWVWQFYKMLASKYRGGVLVTSDEPDKGKCIEAIHWLEGYMFRDATRTNSPARFISTESLCLIDDKASSFVNWTGPGFCLWRIKPTAKQEGELPPHIRVIRSLDELTTYEGRIVHVDDARLSAVAQTAGGLILPGTTLIEPIVDSTSSAAHGMRTMMIY